MFKLNPKKAALYLCLAVFYLGAAELVLRLFDPEVVLVKTFDDHLLFSLYPEKKGNVVSEEYKVSVETNAEGGRQTLDPSNEYPILLLGDSFTEGWGVDEKEVFSSIANLSLPANRRIRNMGVHGSCPALFQIHLREFVSKYNPKEVWIQIFDNDLDDNEKLEMFMTFQEGVPSPLKPTLAKFTGTTIYNFLKESSLFRLAKRGWKTYQGIPEPILYYKEGREPKVTVLSHAQSLEKYGKLAPLGSEITKKYNGQFGFYEDPNSSVWVSRFQKQKDHLTKIYEFLNSKGIGLNLIYVPAKEFFAEGGILGKQTKRDLNLYQEANPHYQLLKEFCDSHKLGCLFTTELFWKENPENLYFPYDAHWNREGHALFGKKLGEILQKSSR
ncbi:SGNH/GDSL hydrolase family protein [Leptospira idonii]|uniref:SGNH/GDSL hydrolase family protein n=1 Tax=Leptospira idonii TaxID=1193500 RepID=A0A4R9M3E4_9LEPT|nr:SGNH/GDSL hydrolase family protein [Leptospira idonii]TGN20405.1 SGNH/GDSL hydrolase family protein [Leptospira idonii]